MSGSDTPIDLSAVKQALSAELAKRGKRLAGDSTGTNRPLYIMGTGDVAAMVFEIKRSADDAVHDLMYQGAWISGMPPRFAVVPATDADVGSLEMLGQLRAHPILFDMEDGTVRFRDLDGVLTAHCDG